MCLKEFFIYFKKSRKQLFVINKFEKQYFII